MLEKICAFLDSFIMGLYEAAPVYITVDTTETRH